MDAEQGRTSQEDGDMDALTTGVDEPIDDAKEQSVAPVRYEITSFGIDFDVDGLYRRLEKGEIVVPGFQRNYVWTLRDASRFIESLILGLPVPGIFLSRDLESGEYIVIDGQQRLKSIQFFFNGIFNPSANARTQRTFRLTGVQKEFESLTYNTLGHKDRRELTDAVIHATVVKQDSPEADDTSIYHIFDRINSSGRRLTQQEIRSAIYHGGLIDALDNMNQYPGWRSIFGKIHSRQRDEELILRFLAFLFDGDTYKEPLSEFLTKFLARHKNPNNIFLDTCNSTFQRTIDMFLAALDGNIFRPERAFNAAVFDSMSVALAKTIASAKMPLEPSAVAHAYHNLLQDNEYMGFVARATADEQSVKMRMNKAFQHFSNI